MNQPAVSFIATSIGVNYSTKPSIFSIKSIIWGMKSVMVSMKFIIWGIKAIILSNKLNIKY